ncbi:tyrosine-type recombinase/integrase [Eleftheria terrae]|uniref:tyrosine-type recombinase/integrase n=1 Tax=Eleftheria terrae TaxID=1597781 RepID=UPI00263B68AD|nr:tyrosine-type recombinase/integrase [Eleftheria terrae]WKB53035.1 tyrosine-type recombinase/integrase [Eleftheria terrae]
MASIIRVGEKWRAQVRRKGFPPQTKTFDTKILAEKWARKIESEIDHGRAGLNVTGKGLTVGQLIDRYTTEVGEAKPFGKNKADVLKKLKLHLQNVEAGTLTAERVVQYVTEERRVSGVTAAIDLTYLKGVFKVAKALWRFPVQPSVIDDAREILKYMGQVNRSNERDRRPTAEEIEKLRGWFLLHSKSLTPDLMDFILDSCFRPPSEITRLLWSDLNEADRTIIIRDRKDPRKKIGNHQTVPLLGRCFDIIMRQPRIGPRIFPVNGKSWSSIFPRACAALGIDDLQLYDLRHEAISRLVESKKYSLAEMMLITGHKDPKQLMRYTQLRARDLHR